MKERHLKTKTPTWNAWINIKQRCLNPNNSGYKYYGGRGIKICHNWRKSFPSFLRDMGERPSKKHSIERINNNRGYSKTNCKWATRFEQARNKRNTIFKKTDIVIIKRLYELGVNSLILSSAYKCHSSTIRYIISQKLWRNPK